MCNRSDHLLLQDVGDKIDFKKADQLHNLAKQNILATYYLPFTTCYKFSIVIQMQDTR